ncbi:MAG: tetratricopeptide repeat protein [Bdellovibrionales bacterium]|jgi:tetratricopeptide (TPR) repeat protein
MKPIAAFLIVVALFLSGCDKPEQKAARYIERGNAYYEQENYVKARLEYKNAAQQLPASAEVRYHLGLVDEAEGDFQNAFANYSHAEEQDAHYAPALLKLSQYFMAGDQHEQALKRLNTVLSSAPNNAEAHALLGAVYLRQKKLDEAEKEALSALQKEPANITATSVLTGLYREKGDEAKAVSVLEEGLKNSPKNVSLLLLKAALYEKSKNLPKITEAYETIFKLKPNESRYRLSLASFYAKAADLDGAEKLLRKTATDFPEDWDIKHKLVDFLDNARDLESAEQEIHAIMEKHPDHNEPYFWLADLYMAHKDTDRAAALLEKIVIKDTQSPASLNASATLARLHVTKGDRALAQKLVATILEKNAGHADALFIRATMAFDDGAYQAAVTDLRSIIRDNPKTISSYQLLSEVLLSQGRLDLALDTLEQLLEHNPDNIPARVRLAQMMEAKGNAKQGLEHLALVTKAMPSYAIGWESTARLAISAQNWPLAEEALEKLQAFEGQTLTATFLKGRMLAAQGKTEEAIAHFQQIIKAEPLSPLAEHAMGSFVALEEKAERPQSIIDFIQSLPEKSVFALTSLGESYLKTNKPQEAAAAFDQVIATGAHNPKPYLGRAFLLTKEKQIDKAIAVLEKGMTANPADYKIPLTIAGLYDENGHSDEAIALYEKLLARNPDLNVAANNMAQSIADHRFNDSAALEKARLAAERFISSPNPLLMDTLAWVYFRQGKLDQALTIMDRAMAATPPLPAQMYYHYGALMAKRGDKPRAKEALEKAVAMGETYAGDKEAKELLEELK